VPRKLRVGIIGIGTIGRLHLEAAQRAGGIVVAIGASGTTRAAELAAEHEIAAYADYRDILADDAIEVVHVCTPNYLHYPMVSDALRAGKHVLCEKPLGLTSGESMDLLRQAEQAGVVHAMGFNNRFFPLVIEAREKIARGALGRIFAVRGFILEDSLLSSAAIDWRLDPAVGGETLVMSTIGCHLVDLMSYVVGSPIEAVCADFLTVHPTRRRLDGESANPLEEVAHLLLRFANGARGVIGVSRATAGRRYKVTLEVDGTESSLAWDSEAPNQLWQGHDNQPNAILLRDPNLLCEVARRHTSYLGAYQEAFADTMKSLVRSVYRRILSGSGGEGDYPTFADGHAAQLVQDAAVESSRSGRWVEVPAIMRT
jgi:predicted dehydrogenase